MLEKILFSAAKQMGFLAEVDAKKWIYRGERFRLLPFIEHLYFYSEKTLRMIGLF